MSENTTTLANVTLDNRLRAKSGGLIKFADFARNEGYDLEKKEDKKLARSVYDKARIEFYRYNRKVLAVAAADPSFNITKMRVVKNDAGKLTGFDSAGRIPTKSTIDGAAAALAAKEAELEQLKATMATILGKLSAIGVTPEQLAQVPALS